MPPKNFADDGAAGAGGGSSAAPSGSLGGVTMNDPGPGTSAPSPPPNVDQAGAGGTMAPVNTGRGGYSDITGPQLATLQAGGGSPLAPGQGGISPVMAQLQAGGGSPLPSGGGGFSFADGGAIPDDQGGDGTPGQTSMQDALQSVDATMQALYAKYGLSDGGNKEGDGQQTQTAGMMPTIPGNQSETPGPYVPQQPKPQQVAAAMPMIPGNQSETPGPYVPQQPKPQQTGAIDTDEDTA